MRARVLPAADGDVDGSAEHYAQKGGLELGLRLYQAVEATCEWLV